MKTLKGKLCSLWRQWWLEGTLNLLFPSSLPSLLISFFAFAFHSLPFPLLLHFSPSPLMVYFLSLLQAFSLCLEPLTMPHHEFFCNITFSFCLQQCNNLLLHICYNIFPPTFFFVLQDILFFILYIYIIFYFLFHWFVSLCVGIAFLLFYFVEDHMMILSCFICVGVEPIFLLFWIFTYGYMVLFLSTTLWWNIFIKKLELQSFCRNSFIHFHLKKHIKFEILCIYSFLTTGF